MKFKTITLLNLAIFLIGFAFTAIGIIFEIGKQDTFLCIPRNAVQNVLISVGCSIMATSIISFVMTWYLNDDKEARRVIDSWGLKNIEVRSALNYEINEKLDTMKDGMDIIAFGMKNFLAAKKQLLEDKIEEGCTIRMLTIAPESKFVTQREREEKEPAGQIKNSIEELIAWAKEVKSRNTKGTVIVKTYDSLPQDMYQKVDKYVYVGPFQFGKPSQQTIAYEYRPGSKGARYYSDYFLKIWDDADFCKEIV
ncbi:MAG: hypothetical protein D3909_03850 [Candidatus Electrothrix sp. ATG1]|nr:hypothetical protein [Candidatus Electrothrix sp. ATG1]